MTRLNVITLRVETKLTTRTLSRVSYVGWMGLWTPGLDFDKTKSPTEVWGIDHRENETGYD